MDLAAWLVQAGRRVLGWDPLAMPEASRSMGNAIQLMPSAEECLRESDVAVITNPLREFSAIDWSAGSSTTVVDCWRCLSPQTIAHIARYVPLGQGAPGDVAAWVQRKVGDDFGQLTD